MPSKTYYVSSLHGSADFDGLTPQTPFLHPAQVSALSLQPGDKVLLERGSVFAGEAMHLKNCGDIAGAPIEIGAYGTGDALPCIAANGTGVWYQDYGTPLDFDGHVYRGEVSSAVLLYDVENIVLRDLEITNDAPFTDLESYCAADTTSFVTLLEKAPRVMPKRAAMALILSLLSSRVYSIICIWMAVSRKEVL